MYSIGLSPELVGRVFDSEAVQALSGQTRFDLFRHPEVDPEVFTGLLDIDFENRQHLAKTALIGAAICDLEGVNAETTERVVLTALVHDAAESVVGDRNIHTKKDGDDEQEIDMMGAMVADGRLKLTQEELEIVAEIMSDKHGDECTTLEGRLFDLSEIAGYVLSGATAWRASKDYAVNMGDKQRRLFQVLPFQVFSTQLLHLWHYETLGFKTPSHVSEGVSQEITEVFGLAAQGPALAHDHERTCLENGFTPEKVAQINQNAAITAELWNVRNLPAPKAA